MSVGENASREKINGKTLDEWDALWEKLDGGFAVEHPETHHAIGLYRGDLNGLPQVMGSATDFDKGGLYKRLQTLRSEIVQTGNDHKSADFIRENIEHLTLYVLKVGKGAGLEKITLKLEQKMRKRYRLKWGKVGQVDIGDM